MVDLSIVFCMFSRGYLQYLHQFLLEVPIVSLVVSTHLGTSLAVKHLGPSYVGWGESSMHQTARRLHGWFIYQISIMYPR